MVLLAEPTAHPSRLPDALGRGADATGSALIAAAGRAVSAVRCPHCPEGATGAPGGVVSLAQKTGAGGAAEVPESPAAPGWVCSQCAATYPLVGGIPCLLPDPVAAIARWETALGRFATATAQSADRLLAQSVEAGVPASARRRLSSLRAALPEHGRRILALFAEVGLEPASDINDADPQDLPRVDTYYHQLIRDWSWDAAGSGENADAFARVRAAVDLNAPPKKILVLGAGACRLSVDLHRHVGAELTLAADINLLPLVVVRALIAGRRVPLFEFPVSPRTSADAVVERVLETAQPIPEGFLPVVLDGLDPPIVPGTVDTLFTPWFIDQVPKDLRGTIEVAARCLPPGGQWINHGPLIYHPDRTLAAHRYRQDEVLEMVAAAGFEIEHQSWDRLLYMESPAGSQGRTEGVLTFRARKVKERSARAAAPTPWLDDPDLPVERMAGLESYAPPHPMFAAVVSLIDGTRSARQIADIMIEKHGLPADAALVGVTACLRDIHQTLRGP